MNELLIVGSVALDSVKTPFGNVKEALGGSATYASYAASFFTPVRLVGVVGDDFPVEHVELLKSRKIDVGGLQSVRGKTFRWSGAYEYDLNEAHTLATELNVFETFKPQIPAAYKKSDFVFLANIDPDLQLSVLEQVEKPRLVACDTMNLWIRLKPEALKRVIKQVDFFFINEGEARLFSGMSSLIKAGRLLQSWGPKFVVIKKGEHGALLFGDKTLFTAPAFPLEDVYDPTGAGDTFAGGFFGYLANSGGDISDANLRKAVVYGSAMASFTVEKFSLERLKTLSLDQLTARVHMLKEFSRFDNP